MAIRALRISINIDAAWDVWIQHDFCPGDNYVGNGGAGTLACDGPRLKQDGGRLRDSYTDFAGNSAASSSRSHPNGDYLDICVRGKRLQIPLQDLSCLSQWRALVLLRTGIRRQRRIH